jgi:dTDP-glucose 4,6-dehydratase
MNTQGKLVKVTGPAHPRGVLCTRATACTRRVRTPIQRRHACSWDDARMKLLVCGGAGFIGSTFVRLRVREQGDEVTVLDKLTYAGREENLREVADAPGYRFVRGAIEDPDAVAGAIEACGPDAIVNFAAETHVDRSIAEPDAFVKTHALGTHVLLEAARAAELRYLQVSTDEVYGSIEQGSFTEDSPLRPSSPYSATKTGADLLVQSYFHTYDLPAVICRGSNNYGPYQYPEKLIPLMILNALHGDSLPVYGDGMQVRNWIHATDFARAIGHVLEHGVPGEVYNAGGPDECANVDVVKRIIELTGAEESQIEYVTDRPGHDRRYSLSSEKVRALGWLPRVRFDEGLEETVAWYRENTWWWEPIRSGDYREYYERQYGRALS